MPRPRLRPDHHICNYTYHCLMDGAPPQQLWDTARAMQTLWNRLVDLHETLREGWDKNTPADVKHDAYTTLWGTEGSVYQTVLVEGKALGLSAWQKWHVHDTFKHAMQAFAKRLCEAPHRHSRLKYIHIPHRTDSGGVPVEWLWRESEHKHTAILPAEDGHHYRRAYTTIGGVRVPLLVLMHRPLPAGAVVKRIALLGTHEPSLRTSGRPAWQWRLQIAIEIPRPPVRLRTGRSVGLDLGWRVLPHGLRVGMLHDGTHAHELILPWNMANRFLRRRQDYYMARGVRPDATGEWRQLWRWRTAIDEALEACKAAISTCDQSAWPDEARALWSGHLRVRAGGLRRLRRILAWQDGALASDARDLECLETWHAWHSVQMRRYRGSELAMHRARNDLYRHMADWIARHYDAVSLEGDLDLRQFAERPNIKRRTRGEAGDNSPLDDQDKRERRANKHRQIAGTSTLRGYIVEAMRNAGRVIHEAPAAYTSRTCMICAARMVESADVWRICPDGHSQDCDVAASYRLWLALPEAMRDGALDAPVIDHPQLLRGLHLVDVVEMSQPGSGVLPATLTRARASA